MPKDNEVDEKAVAFAADDGNGGILWGKGWMFARTKGRQAVIPLYSAATVAELRAEVERRKDALAAMSQFAKVAEQRADAAERRLSEVREIQRTHYGDGIGLHVAMILWTRDYDALTGADPT